MSRVAQVLPTQELLLVNDIRNLSRGDCGSLGEASKQVDHSRASRAVFVYILFPGQQELLLRQIHNESVVLW